MRKSSFVAVLVVGALLVPLAVFAGHSFNDVPDSHTFHNAIDWMKDNNITVGCNPPANTNFCPNDNVTRGQMSAFMKRLAENNIVDAATLDGADSVAFQSPIWGAATDWSIDGLGEISGTMDDGIEILDLVVSPPGNGVLSLNYNLGVYKSLAAYEVVAWLQYDNTSCVWGDRIPATSTYYESEASTGNAYRYGSSTVVKSTTAGNHTLQLCAFSIAGSPVNRLDASIVVTFSATGLATAGVLDTTNGGSAFPEG